MVLEIVGYIGSALVVVSMLMSSIYKLRIINTVGSVISCTYALLVGAMPLALMNACLIVINLYNLYKLKKSEKPYETVSCEAGDSLVQYLLSYYGEDIAKFFPDFDAEKASGDRAFVIFCEGEPVGFLLGRQDERFFDVDLDYTVAAHRDLSVAKHLYSRLPESGINRLRYARAASDEHTAYLQKMGYAEENGEWMLRIQH